MSCTSPLTVASTTVPLPPWSDFSMCGSRKATAAFIVSADCSTKGSCISPEAKRSPTTFMPSSRMSLTMASAAVPDSSASVRSSSSPLRLPSMMRCERRRSTGQSLWSSAGPVSALTPSNNDKSSCRGS